MRTSLSTFYAWGKQISAERNILHCFVQSLMGATFPKRRISEKQQRGSL